MTLIALRNKNKTLEYAMASVTLGYNFLSPFVMLILSKTPLKLGFLCELT